MQFPGVHSNSFQNLMYLGLPFEKNCGGYRILGNKISGCGIGLDRFHGKCDMNRCLSDVKDSEENWVGK